MAKARLDFIFSDGARNAGLADRAVACLAGTASPALIACVSSERVAACLRGSDLLALSAVAATSRFMLGLAPAALAALAAGSSVDRAVPCFKTSIFAARVVRSIEDRFADCLAIAGPGVLTAGGWADLVGLGLAASGPVAARDSALTGLETASDRMMAPAVRGARRGMASFVNILFLRSVE